VKIRPAASDSPAERIVWTIFVSRINSAAINPGDRDRPHRGRDRSAYREADAKLEIGIRGAEHHAQQNADDASDSIPVPFVRCAARPRGRPTGTG
jgi:hypothetical protein